jgi:hypothetical protein
MQKKNIIECISHLTILVTDTRQTINNCTSFASHMQSFFVSLILAMEADLIDANKKLRTTNFSPVAW